MNEEFYKKFLDYLVSEIEGLWYKVYAEKRYTYYSWGYECQTIDEDNIEDRYDFKSYQEVAEDIVKYLKVAK